MHNLKNVKKTPGGVLLLVKLQAESCNFTKSDIPPWVFFTFFKLYEWFQIAQSTTFYGFVLPNFSYYPFAPMLFDVWSLNKGYKVVNQLRTSVFLTLSTVFSSIPL